MADKVDNSFTILQDLEYRENDQDNYDVLSKNKLDLFLPKNSDTNTPVVIFVHGGGWMRGDRRSRRYFFSLYDTNLLMYLLMSFYDAYWNVGKAFARNGVACAVISYRLSRLEFPWVLVEVCCSFVCSVIVVLAPLLFLVILPSVFIPVAHLDYNFNVQILGIISLLTLWTLVCISNKSYRMTKYDKVRPVIFSLVLAYLIPLYSITFRLLVWLGLLLLYSFITLHQRIKPAKHPGHLCDISKSVKWVKDYGMSSKRFSCDGVFLCGHSAGGHAVSLLAFDSSYLENVGLSLSDIRVSDCL